MRPEHVDRFRLAAIEVLGADDPALDLEPDERWWAAGVLGKRHPYSGQLRDGLAKTLVLLAVHGAICTFPTQVAVDGIVRELLRPNNEDRLRRWSSLANWLPEFAEASPDEFLAACEEFAADDAAVATYFKNRDVIFASIPHVHLLWALERLAWSEAYFSRTILALGAFAEHDPGGNLHNRPLNTLTGILLPWHPQTTASIEARLEAIELLCERHAEVSWRVLVSLFPGESRLASNTATPQWREWKPAEDPPVTNNDYWRYTEALVRLAFRLVGTDADRWESLVDLYGQLRGANPQLASEVLSKISGLAPESLPRTDRIAIAEHLRRFIARHREFSDAEWAMNDNELAPLDEVLGRLQPPVLSEQFRWLFASWPDLHTHRDVPYEQRVELVDEERRKAIEAIYDAEGIDAILEMADKVEAPEVLGRAIAASSFGESVAEGVLAKTLHLVPTRNEVPSRLRVGLGFVNGMWRRHGEEWARRVLDDDSIGWDSNRRANFAWNLPQGKRVWDLLDSIDPEAARLYWSRTPVRFLEDAERDLEIALNRLLAAERPLQAVDLMWSNIRRSKTNEQSDSLPIPAGVIVKVLEAAGGSDPTKEWPSFSLSMVSHAVEDLLDIIEGEVEQEQIVSLEWLWLPALERSRRGLKGLRAALSNSPKLFVDTLCLAYRGEGEPARELSELNEARATHAFKLLHEWKHVPGSSLPTEGRREGFGNEFTPEQGEVLEDKLFEWVHEARRLAKEKNRLSVADIQIGEVLAYAPADADGGWPCASVCKLIESLQCEQLERGFVTGLYNRRGVHFRTRGGELDHRLAMRFYDLAKQRQDRFPRTAACLRQIAEGYEAEGRHHDERDALEEFE